LIPNQRSAARMHTLLENKSIAQAMESTVEATGLFETHAAIVSGVTHKDRPNKNVVGVRLDL
jgi:hypothetical protein